jgi:hypothetical protein
MTILRRATPLLLLIAAFGAQAQVYRCGDAKVYTDKPCSGAEAVDLRANLLEAGPRSTPPEQEKDSHDAAETSRTTGTFPR